MNNDYTTKNILCRTFTKLHLLPVNHKKLKKCLEKQWEISLNMYAKVAQKFHQCKDQYFSYFCQKETPSNYNYLILAQINHLLSYNKKIQYLIRNLAQKEVQCKYQEDLLSNTSHKKSFFVRWLLRLWSVQFIQSMKKYSVYLAEKTFLLKFDNININIQYLHSNLCLRSKDLLLMQFSFYKMQKWYQHCCNFSKLNKYIPLIFDRHHVNYAPINFHNLFGWLYTKQLMNVKDIYLTRDNLDIKNQGNCLLLSKYSHLLKYLVKSNQSSTQKNLIKQINTSIRYQDRCFFRNDQDNNYKFLNATLDKNLSLWGMYRHNNHSLRWYKKRYWCYFEDGMYFSIFS